MSSHDSPTNRALRLHYPAIVLRLPRRRKTAETADRWRCLYPVPGDGGDHLIRMKSVAQVPPSAASSYVCPVDDAAETFVAGVVVAPNDVPADHAGLFLVAGVVGAVQREVPQRRELRLYPV